MTIRIISAKRATAPKRKTMHKGSGSTRQSDMRQEYDFRGGTRGQYAARYGWEEAAQRRRELGEDRLLDKPTPTKWESSDWKW